MTLPVQHPPTASITYTKATTQAHFQQILKLQSENLYSALTPEQQSDQGFVFAQHTLEILQQMAEQEPQIIALHQNQVVGYNLSMPLSMANVLPSLKPMFEQFDKIDFQGKLLSNYSIVVGGQVCVDARYRGQGLLHQLYTHIQNYLCDRYELCVTEIATRNTRSLKSHERAGFKIAATYHDGAEEWHIVVLDFRK